MLPSPSKILKIINQKKNFISNNRWPTIEDIEDEEELEEDPEPMDEDDFSRRMASYPHSGPLRVPFVTSVSPKRVRKLVKN